MAETLHEATCDVNQNEASQIRATSEVPIREDVASAAPSGLTRIAASEVAIQEDVASAAPSRPTRIATNATYTFEKVAL